MSQKTEDNNSHTENAKSAFKVDTEKRSASILWKRQTVETSREQAFDIQLKGSMETAHAALMAHLVRFPNDIEALLRFGELLLQRQEFEQAIAAFIRVLTQEPGNIAALVGTGKAHWRQNRLKKAITFYRKAIEADPQDTRGQRYSLAVLLSKDGQWQEAIEQIDSIPENEGRVSLNSRLCSRGLMKFQIGNMREGAMDYENRELETLIQGNISTLPRRWKGEKLKKERLLIVPEQGFGDTIAFARWITLLKQQQPKARISLLSKPGLGDVLSTLQIEHVSAINREDREHYDMYVPLMSLMHCCKFDGLKVPPPPPLQIPEYAKQDFKWLKKHALGMVKMGMVWSGNPAFLDNHLRSVPFSQMLRLASVPGIQIYSLQMGDQKNDIAQNGASSFVFDMAPMIRSFDDTLAIIDKLDLVVTTDTATCHLAGSLGKPVLLLLHTNPVWMFATDERVSAWYPGMRAVRQTILGDWSTVIDAVITALEQYKKSGDF